MSIIRRMKNGSYQTDVRDKDGRRIRLTFTSRTEANALCSNIEKEKYNLRLIGVGLAKRKVNFSTAIKEAIEEKASLAPKSFQKYRNVYLTFQNFVEKKNLQNISDFTVSHADEYRKILSSSSASAKTINFYLLAVKAMFRNYVLKDDIRRNPFDHVKMERLKKKTLLEREADYYSSEEIKSFFKQDIPQRHRQSFTALFLTGMRFAEMSNLTWERIDMEKKIIEIRSDASFTTKTASSERNIPMSDKLFKMLSELKKHSSSQYLFVSEAGKKLNEKTILTLCKTIAKKAGIQKNATLHKWRHSFNSHLAQNGVDYSIRQYLMGHIAQQTMTDHYTKIDPSKLHSDISLLDNLIP